MFFPFRFFDEGPQVFLMNRWEGTRCTWRRAAVGRFVERRTLLVKAVALRFQGGGGDDVDYRYEKTGTRASVLECPLYEGEAWGLLLAFVAFVHSLDDGFGQIERGIGKKHVVSLF